MTWWRGLSLGAKLNLALLAFLAMLGSATLAIIVYGFNRTQDDADARSNEALEQGGSLALQAVAGGASEQGGLLFEAVAEVGQRSALYLGTRAGAVEELQAPPPFMMTATGHSYDPSPTRVTDTVVVNGAPRLDDPRVLDDIAFSAPLDAIFPVLLQSFAGDVGGANLDPIAIVYISPNGVTRYYPAVGIHDRLPSDADFTERMTAIGPEQNPERRTIWTAPYEDSAGQGLIATARTPVYVGETFRGSMEVDVSMSNVFAQIARIRPTPRAFAFYVDANGTLLEGRSFPLLNTEVATNAKLSETLDAMRSIPPGDTSTFDAKLPLAGEDYYIAYNTVPGLGGTFAVAAPVSDLTAAAAGISSGIDEEGTRTLQVMVAAMAALFALGLAGAAYLNRNAVIKPINSLVTATKAVAAGDLDAKVPISGRGDEFGELESSFNTMVERLRESERKLEERVEARTQELEGLLEISQELAANLSREDLVANLIRVAGRLFDSTSASVAAVEPDGTATLLGSNNPVLATFPKGLQYDFTEAGLIFESLRNGSPVVMGNVRGDDELAVAYRTWMGPRLEDTYADVRAWMGVPFMSKGALIGWLAVSNTRPDRYDEEDVRVATAMANQAAIAFENVRLYEEAVQRTSELNTLLLADSELHRSLSLDAVLESLVDVMMDSLKADKCIISMAVPGANNLAIRASRNMSQRSIDRINALHVAAGARGPIEVTGIIKYEDTSTMEPDIRAVLEDEGVRSTLDAPIYTPAGVAGGFDLGYTSPHTFTANELRLAEAIAERAGVAIHNAQLVDEAAQRSRETEALLRADAELFRSLNLDAVMNALVDVAVDVLGVDKSLVVLHEGDIDVIRAARNYTPENLASFNRILTGIPHEEPPPAGQEAQVYSDARLAPGYLAPALAREGIASHISIPIKDSQRMLGAFSVSFVQPHTFTADEQRLYMALADRAAVAIKNAELYERAQHAASLEERQRLARELHDSVSQALFGIALGAQTARLRIDTNAPTAAEPIEYVMSLAQAGLAEMRALIFELRPESLEKEGLVAALEKQAAATQARYSLPITLELGEEPDAPIDVKEALYRIAQEAMHNIVKHAQASQAGVKLTTGGDGLVLTVEDNGRGFDAGGEFPGHVGLVSMRERVERLGGTVTIESAAGLGTRVTARIRVA